MSRRLQQSHCTDALCLAVRTNAFLKTKMCPRLDSCPLGKNCSFAHSLAELRPLPEFKKTAICYNFRRGKCTNPDCKFAHGEEDMMGYIPQTSPQPRKICPYFIAGCCADEECLHAHMESRRAASRLKTFLIALRSAILSSQQAGEALVPIEHLRQKLKGGIPWQSLGFASFREAVLFLPGTHVSADDQYISFSQTSATREIFNRLQELVDSHKRDLSSPLTPRTPRGGLANSGSSSISSDRYFSPLPGESQVPVHTPTTFGLPQQLIKPEQVLGSQWDFFVCPVCEGVAMDPVITEKCSHVICKLCLEIWRSLDTTRAFNCPRCQVLVQPSEVTPVHVDSASPTAAALAVIYESIQVECGQCQTVWNPRSYLNHPCSSVARGSSAVSSTAFSTSPAPRIGRTTGSRIAIGDFESSVDSPLGPNVLPVKKGDRLELAAESDSGWAFVSKLDAPNEAGWTPASYLSPVHVTRTDSTLAE